MRAVVDKGVAAPDYASNDVGLVRLEPRHRTSTSHNAGTCGSWSAPGWRHFSWRGASGRMTSQTGVSTGHTNVHHDGSTHEGLRPIVGRTSVDEVYVAVTRNCQLNLHINYPTLPFDPVFPASPLLSALRH